MTSRASLVLLALLIVGGFPSASAAQLAPGVQAGVSGDPDQFFVGAHLESGPFVDRLRFRPGIDFGFGDNLTTIAGNLDFVYRVPFPRSAWSMQIGAGPAINVYNFDDDSEVEPGFNVLFGVRHSRGFFTELRFGFIDSPEIKWAIGYTFR